ncbi:MAG TPA: hypothetical protein VFU21_20360 [Kofleriaceae bacterium]|nr:hypothetical protein [Kofleriaceae bacterium]
MRHGLVGCLALALGVAAFGCGGDEADESISGVIPGEMFAGRSADVLIIGNNTSWEEGVQVSLGEGITVDSVTVASPTALMVTATADATAEPGVRQVSVDDLAFSDAFEVTSPVVVKLQGQTAQGSVSIVSVQNLDFANPFDTTTTGDGFFTPLEYVNIAVTSGEGATAQISFVEPFAMEFLLLTDVNAAPGVVDLEVLSGPAGQQQSFRYPAAYEVEAREAVALQSGEPVTASVDEPFQSHLYMATAESLSVMNFTTFAESPDAQPAFALLPASGSFAELITYDSVSQFVGDDAYYLVYWDGSGMSGYSYRIDASIQAALALEESEPNNTTAAAAKPATMPAVVQAAKLTVTDEDWIRVRIPAGSANKSIHVFTYGADPLTDTAVQIFLSNGTSKIAEGDDQGYHENVASAPMGPGTYYVKVFGSPGYFDPEHDVYSVAVVLE